MYRKDAVDNKTLGESLLYFIGTVASGMNTKFNPDVTIVRSAYTHVYTTLFAKQVNDYDAAQTLDSLFFEMADTVPNLSILDVEFLKACGTICRDYAEWIYHISNEEAAHLPF